MMTMNPEPISWVGDMYNRFESMCLELEEAICQDTVKFVEEKVHTAGIGVKKFYSDFMHDLFSPSLLDTEDNFNVVLGKKSIVISEKKSVDIDAQQLFNNCDGIANSNNSVDSAPCCLEECNVIKPHESISHDSVEEQYADENIENHFVKLDLSNLDADATKDLNEKKECNSLSATSRPNEFCESCAQSEIHTESNEHLCEAVDSSLNSNSVIEAICSENDEGFRSSGVVNGSETTVPIIENSFPNFTVAVM